ncbi:MAG: type II toxin-antitoxin system RelE/ParE family toxin [Actinobacteria bacterium]|nr:type II toxin-antitoxin system RelE/ParE family toxin [Actinomycetota bacterium]
MEWKLEFYVTEKGDSPVEESIGRLSKKAGAKILRWLDLLEKFGLSDLRDYIKKLEGYELFELKILHAANYYRLFFSPYEDKRLVFFHLFSKKSKKTPRREIETAMRRKRDYEAR